MLYIENVLKNLGIKVTKFNNIGSVVHHYDHLQIKLHIFEILAYQEDIYAKENQGLLYLNAFESNEKFIDSTFRVLNYLSLPRYCSITSIDADNYTNEETCLSYIQITY